MLIHAQLGDRWHLLRVLNVKRGRKRAEVTLNGARGFVQTTLLYHHGGLCKCRRCTHAP